MPRDRAVALKAMGDGWMVVMLSCEDSHYHCLVETDCEYMDRAEEIQEYVQATFCIKVII